MGAAAATREYCALSTHEHTSGVLSACAAQTRRAQSAKTDSGGAAKELARKQQIDVMLRRDRMRELVDVADRDLKRAQVSFTSLCCRCASSCTLPPCYALPLLCPCPCPCPALPYPALPPTPATTRAHARARLKPSPWPRPFDWSAHAHPRRPRPPASRCMLTCARLQRRMAVGPVRCGALGGRQGDSARAVQRRSLGQEAKDQHARNILNAEKRLADAKAAEKAARDQELSPLASLVPRVGARTDAGAWAAAHWLGMCPARLRLPRRVAPAETVAILVAVLGYYGYSRTNSTSGTLGTEGPTVPRVLCGDFASEVRLAGAGGGGEADDQVEKG